MGESVWDCDLYFFPWSWGSEHLACVCFEGQRLEGSKVGRWLIKREKEPSPQSGPALHPLPGLSPLPLVFLMFWDKV